VSDRLRLAEILTTSSAVANYLGERDVSSGHMLAAIDILSGKKTLDDLGRPLSPLLSRATGAGSGAQQEVKDLAQRWLAVLGGDVQAELDEGQLDALREELVRLDAADGDG
jgi:hypothetical protein